MGDSSNGRLWLLASPLAWTNFLKTVPWPETLPIKLAFLPPLSHRCQTMRESLKVLPAYACGLLLTLCRHFLRKSWNSNPVLGASQKMKLKQVVLEL